MKPTPITGSVNEKGVFTAKNPYENTNSHSGEVLKGEYSEQHPELFCYTPSNVLVTDEEHVEVVKAYQYYSNAGVWITYEYSEDFYLTVQGYETREVYITTPPTEKETDLTLDEYYKLSEADQLKCVKIFYKNIGYNVATDPVKWVETTEADYNKHNNNYRKVMYRIVDSTPIAEAQPLDGVKTADISQPKKTPAEIWVHQYLLNEGWEQNSFGVISAEFDGSSCNLTYVIAHALEAYHAQFETDAGGDLHSVIYSAIAHGLSDVEVNRNISDDINLCVDNVIKAISAPSTHSSSEMVEKYKQALIQIRRVEKLTPESEAMINKLLNL